MEQRRLATKRLKMRKNRDSFAASVLCCGDPSSGASTQQGMIRRQSAVRVDSALGHLRELLLRALHPSLLVDIFSRNDAGGNEIAPDCRLAASDVLIIVKAANHGLGFFPSPVVVSGGRQQVAWGKAVTSHRTPTPRNSPVGPEQDRVSGFHCGSPYNKQMTPIYANTQASERYGQMQGKLSRIFLVLVARYPHMRGAGIVCAGCDGSYA